MTGMGVEMGAQAARARALAVLRIRSRALAVALLPAAVAVVLLAGASTGHFVGSGWHAARWVVTPVAVLVLLAAAAIALVVARARPAVSPTVPIGEEQAPDLYRLVRDLADRLDVPAPSAIALTPDCDSWLEDRTHPSHGPPPPAEDRDEDGLNGLHGGSSRGAHRRTPAAPVLVIGSPFLWWMRVGELRAVLAPVVAGTGPSAHPDIAQARRFVRGLDAAVAVASTRGRCPGSRAVCAGIGWVARLLLRSCRDHAAEMERGVAAAAAERAQAVDYGLRIVAQEQVGLAYAGWDRLLTRVALPAWRMGRWPSRLDAGVVAALTELSRRDRLAEGFASRLGERPACDLLEEPGTVDEAASLLAARLFHGGPAEPGPDWSPVGWQEYPEEVVDRKWRTDAARLHRVLDALGVRRTTEGPEADGPTLARVLDHLTTPAPGAAYPNAAGHPEPHSPQDETTATQTGFRQTTDRHAGIAAASDASAAREADAESNAGRSQAADAHDSPDRASGLSADSGGDAQANAPRNQAADADDSHAPASDPQAGVVPASDGQAGMAPASDADAGMAPASDADDSHAPASDAQAGIAPASDADAGRDQAAHAPDVHDQAAAAHAARGQARDGQADPARAADASADREQVPDPHTGRDQSADASADSGQASDPHTDRDQTDETYTGPNQPPATGDQADDAHTTPTPTPISAPKPPKAPYAAMADDHGADDQETERSSALAAGITAELAREEAATPAERTASPDPGTTLLDIGALPLFPLQPPRTSRELLTDHVTAMVCCAAMDTAGAVPGLDWLDGPTLLINGERAADLAPRVLSLIEDGDPTPLRAWLVESGIRPEKPVRLV
ncbi:hypothetical protein ACFY5C_05630 [Streptomyces sp. NPDC012935]|uniref:hypothetical protein n=1 Tax=Streptomyces sp. NPDC012935 TaxID=3364857 RepID=UPI00369A69A0